MARPLWQLLIELKSHQKDSRISCEECFMVLEYYADQLTAGADPKALHQPVLNHLARCPDCRAKFAIWLQQMEDIPK